MNNAQIKALRELNDMTAVIDKKDGAYIVTLNGRQIGVTATYAGARELLTCEVQAQYKARGF